MKNFPSILKLFICLLAGLYFSKPLLAREKIDVLATNLVIEPELESINTVLTTDKEIKSQLMQLAKEMLGSAAGTKTVLETAQFWWNQWFNNTDPISDKEIKSKLMRLAKEMLGPAAGTKTVLETAQFWWNQWFN